MAVGLALSAASAAMAAVAFRCPTFGWLITVAFVPMVVAQHRFLPERWSGAAFAIGIGGFVAAYIAGVLDPSFHWWFRALPVAVAIPMWFFGWADRRFHRVTNYRYFAIATPLAWAAVDFLRGGTPFAGTRASLPYALFNHPSLLQPVAITGIAGLNLLIVLVNWCVAGLLLRRVTGRSAVAVGTCVAVWVAGSAAMLRHPGPDVRVAAIQPGVRSADADELARNVAQTREAARRGARLIVWREMTVPFDPTKHETNVFTSLARETGAFLVIGYVVDTRRARRNEAVTISPDGKILGTYAKQHPAMMFSGDDRAPRATGFPTFDTPIGTLASIICFDLDFTDTSRGFARAGAQLVAVPSLDPPNDATTHYPLLVFRAIENRLTMIKAETKYASAIIDPYGRIVAAALSTRGRRATVVADVPLGSAHSPYVTFGDTFGWLLAAASAGLYIGDATRRRRRIDNLVPRRNLQPNGCRCS